MFKLSLSTGLCLDIGYPTITSSDLFTANRMFSGIDRHVDITTIRYLHRKLGDTLDFGDFQVSEENAKNLSLIPEGAKYLFHARSNSGPNYPPGLYCLSDLSGLIVSDNVVAMTKDNNGALNLHVSNLEFHPMLDFVG